MNKKLGLFTAFLLARTALPLEAGTFSLPKLEKTSQQSALGAPGAYLHGVNALGSNPAGLVTPQRELLTQYQPLMLNTDAALLGMALPVRKWGATFGFSYLRMQSSHFDRRDEAGRQQGDFSIQDQMVGFHAARPISLSFLTGGNHAMDLGMSVKSFILQTDSYRASALAFDLGARYSLKSMPLTVSAALLNSGRGPSYNGGESKFPTTFELSGAFRPTRSLTLVAGLGQAVQENKQTLSYGIEYRLMDRISFRTSQILAPARSGLSLDGFSGGFGLQVFKKLGLDYNFQPFSEELRSSGFSGMHVFSVTFKWDSGAIPQGKDR